MAVDQVLRIEKKFPGEILSTHINPNSFTHSNKFKHYYYLICLLHPLLNISKAALPSPQTT